MDGEFQKFLDELRSRISVADVVGAKVKLVRKGKEYMGLCPFHNEKTPSFTVNEAKGFYHCFGCGAHGDIIKFEMEANGLPFMDAVTKLANKAGLAVPRSARETPEEAHPASSTHTNHAPKTAGTAGPDSRRKNLTGKPLLPPHFAACPQNLPLSPQKKTVLHQPASRIPVLFPGAYAPAPKPPPQKPAQKG